MLPLEEMYSQRTVLVLHREMGYSVSIDAVLFDYKHLFSIQTSSIPNVFAIVGEFGNLFYFILFY